MGKHTILLLQATPSTTTRTFHDFPSVNEAMDAVAKMYEHQLSTMNQHVQHITYDIQHLLNYIDRDIHDISALVFDERTQQYAPHGKDWIKQQVFNVMKAQAERAGQQGGGGRQQGGGRRR